MNAFIIDKLNYDLQANLAVIKALESHSNAYMIRLMSHIMNAMDTWNSRIHGRDAQFDIWQEHPASDMHNLATMLHQQLLDTLDSTDPDRNISYQNSKGNTYTNTVLDIFYHLLNHSNYHRGQICRELRQSFDITPPDTNFITYKR